MKIDVTGRVTNFTCDADAFGQMHIALTRTEKIPEAEGAGTREVPAGHVAVRLPDDQVETMISARRKRVRVTIEVVPEE